MCDNASTNDAMVSELQKMLLKFPGEVARMHCFAHIVNLVAKSVIKQFDAPKKGQVMVHMPINDGALTWITLIRRLMCLILQMNVFANSSGELQNSVLPFMVKLIRHFSLMLPPSLYISPINIPDFDQFG